jgi:perosamine synthetase
MSEPGSSPGQLPPSSATEANETPLRAIRRNGGIARLPVLGWAAFAGQRHAALPSIDERRNIVYTTSGRAAIALALRVIGCKAGDRVLVPTYHCPTMIAPVVKLGAVPEFYPLTASGAPSMAYLAQRGRNARAMLVAHYFGFPQPLSELRAFCDANRIAMIEDCAHAFFGVVDGRPVGAWGDVAIASATKFFPVVEGGCLVGDHPALRHMNLKPRAVRDEFRAGIDAVELGARYHRFPGFDLLLRTVFGLKEVMRGRPFEFVTLDDADTVLPASVDELDDELVLHSPTRVSRWTILRAHRARIVAHRRRNYAMFASELADLPGAAPLRPQLPDTVAPYVFPLQVTNPQRRYRALRAERVPLFRWDRVWPGTPALADDIGHRWSTEVFQLACHQDLSENDVRTIAGTIRRVFNTIA